MTRENQKNSKPMANWVPEKEFGELTEQKKKLKDRFGVRKESTKIDIWMRNK